MKTLPDKWDLAILERSKTLLNALEVDSGFSGSWYEAIQIISATKNGTYFSYLAITGCYPQREEIEKFESDSVVSGLRTAVSKLIDQSMKDPGSSRNMVSVRFTTTEYQNIVDVTHTATAPYLTGIQRVVRGVTSDSENILTFSWVGHYGIAKQQKLDNLKKSEEKKSTESWQLRSVKKLHSLVPVLESSLIGRGIKRAALPFARVLKKKLIQGHVFSDIRKNDDQAIENLLFVGKKITIPEIPSRLEHISIYQAIQDRKTFRTQVILYDFIPFFHAWTVHPGNRGHLNSYIRIVLLADKIVSISKLVHEQAQLITKAFKLERKDWLQREQELTYLDLPSGLGEWDSAKTEKESKLLIMAGSVEPRKNHLQFLDALEILALEDTSFRAEILGSAGWENEHILIRLDELRAKGLNVERIGNLDDKEMKNRIAKAQALIQISEAEGFGLPVEEALELGTKVIVSDISPLVDRVNSRVQSVRLGDAKELAKIMREILEQPEKQGVKIKAKTTWKDWQEELFI